MTVDEDNNVGDCFQGRCNVIMPLFKACVNGFEMTMFEALSHSGTIGAMIIG